MIDVEGIKRELSKQLREPTRGADPVRPLQVICATEPGHQNRKARRANAAATRRDAWKAYKQAERQRVTLEQIVREYEREVG